MYIGKVFSSKCRLSLVLTLTPADLKLLQAGERLSVQVSGELAHQLESLCNIEVTASPYVEDARRGGAKESLESLGRFLAETGGQGGHGQGR